MHPLQLEMNRDDILHRVRMIEKTRSLRYRALVPMVEVDWLCEVVRELIERGD